MSQMSSSVKCYETRESRVENEMKTNGDINDDILMWAKDPYRRTNLRPVEVKRGASGGGGTAISRHLRTEDGETSE